MSHIIEKQFLAHAQIEIRVFSSLMGQTKLMTTRNTDDEFSYHLGFSDYFLFAVFMYVQFQCSSRQIMIFFRNACESFLVRDLERKTFSPQIFFGKSTLPDDKS